MAVLTVSWVANDPTQKFHLHLYFVGPFLTSTATGWVPQKKILSCILSCYRCVEDVPGISSYRRKKKEAKLVRKEKSSSNTVSAKVLAYPEGVLKMRVIL